MEISAGRAERFWARVDKTGGCWEWTLSRKPLDGQLWHGFVSINCRAEYAHRVAYTLAYGPIPDGAHVLHHCDNPACVRPEHLYIGTHADNMRDRDARGRTARGERIANSRLTAEDVRQIRRARAEGCSPSVLAARYGVTDATVRHVVRRKTWRHVA